MADKMTDEKALAVLKKAAGFLLTNSIGMAAYDFAIAHIAARLAATAVGVTEAVVEYIAARNAYEDATRKPNSHAPARQLPHGSPITARWVHARHALEAALANQTKAPDHD